MMGSSIVDTVTSDYVVFGKLTTGVFGASITEPAVVAHNRNGQQHYFYRF
jgi:hypothetical protein